MGKTYELEKFSIFESASEKGKDSMRTICTSGNQLQVISYDMNITDLIADLRRVAYLLELKKIKEDIENDLAEWERPYNTITSKELPIGYESYNIIEPKEMPIMGNYCGNCLHPRTECQCGKMNFDDIIKD